MGRKGIVVETELFPHVALYKMLTLRIGSGLTRKPCWTKAQARKKAVLQGYLPNWRTGRCQKDRAGGGSITVKGLTCGE